MVTARIIKNTEKCMIVGGGALIREGMIPNGEGIVFRFYLLTLSAKSARKKE